METSSIGSIHTTVHEKSAPLPLTVIEPPRGIQWLNVHELWQFRELLLFLAWRDIKVRYKQTLLGISWAVLQPLTLMAIFSVVLGQNAAMENLSIPYPVWVFTGLVVWGLFAAGLGSMAESLIASERLISKIYFPRLLLPFSSIGPALVDFLFAGCVLASILVWYQVFPAATIALAPLSLGVVAILMLGVGSFLSAINVTYRDVRHTMGFLLQAWMFATPAIYAPTFASSGGTGASSIGFTKWFIVLNPLNAVISFFRAAIFGLTLPWASLGVALLIACGTLLMGVAYFRHVERRFADVI